MRAFVTGASGFIGSYIVKALVDDGHDVLCLKSMEITSRFYPQKMIPSTADSTIIRMGDSFFFHIFFTKKDTAINMKNMIIDL